MQTKQINILKEKTDVFLHGLSSLCQREASREGTLGKGPSVPPGSRISHLLDCRREEILLSKGLLLYDVCWVRHLLACFRSWATPGLVLPLCFSQTGWKGRPKSTSTIPSTPQLPKASCCLEKRQLATSTDKWEERHLYQTHTHSSRDASLHSGGFKTRTVSFSLSSVSVA